MTPHNHIQNFGQRFDNCPRCRELKANPYVLTFKIQGDRKIRRVEVASVEAANAHVKSVLPAVITRPPIVKTHGGQIVAILRAI